MAGSRRAAFDYGNAGGIQRRRPKSKLAARIAIGTWMFDNLFDDVHVPLSGVVRNGKANERLAYWSAGVRGRLPGLQRPRGHWFRRICAPTLQHGGCRESCGAHLLSVGERFRTRVAAQIATRFVIKASSTQGDFKLYHYRRLRRLDPSFEAQHCRRIRRHPSV